MMANKLAGQGKYVTTARSQAICPLTALSTPLGIMKAMLKLECDFLCDALDKVS
jgi:hypothetical protein